MIGKFSTAEIKYQIKEAISLGMQTYRYQTQQSIIAYRINVTLKDSVHEVYKKQRSYNFTLTFDTSGVSGVFTG